MKYKGFEVRKKTWWTYLYMFRTKAFTALDKIYLSDKYYSELEKGKLSCKLEATMMHEITHIKRFRKFGIVKSELIYWLNKKFRYEEELAAIREEMKVYKKHNKKYYFRKATKALSGFAYLWCADYKTVKNDLNRIWEEV